MGTGTMDRCNSSSKLSRLEKQLTQLEMKHGVTVRWDKDDPQYTCARLYRLSQREEAESTVIFMGYHLKKAVPFKVEEKIC
jgi:hypothetical protein